jgi:TolB protein
MRWLAPLVVSGLALSAAGDEASLAVSTDGQIAYVSAWSGNHEIYTMNADGSGKRRLTRDRRDDDDPVWSPNGKRLAFHRAQGLYVMNADGRPQRLLVRNASNPRWSPNGRRLAFVLGRAGIYVVNADGTGRKRLTRVRDDSYPAWSPDGHRIAFERFPPDANRYSIYVMNADGSAQRPVTGNQVAAYSPAWSPNARRIAFAGIDKTSPSDEFRIYVVNSDGTGLPRAIAPTQESIRVPEPEWSPDGRSIAFVGGNAPVGFGRDIFVVAAAGSPVRRLTRDGWSTEPTWAPDSRKIAFVRSRNWQVSIWVMNANGRNQTRLTRGLVRARVSNLSPFGPRWRPASRPGTSSPTSRSAAGEN